jgi:hypothetical protein
MVEIKPVEGTVIYTPPSGSKKDTVEPVAIKDVTPKFVSVKGNMDPKTGVFVTEVRDTGTGKVSFQYPSQKAAAAYSRSSSDENQETATKSKSSDATVESRQPATSSNATVESKQPVETSASADAVTDGTKANA